MQRCKIARSCVHGDINLVIAKDYKPPLWVRKKSLTLENLAFDRHIKKLEKEKNL